MFSEKSKVIRLNRCWKSTPPKSKPFCPIIFENRTNLETQGEYENSSFQTATWPLDLWSVLKLRWNIYFDNNTLKQKRWHRKHLNISEKNSSFSSFLSVNLIIFNEFNCLICEENNEWSNYSVESTQAKILYLFWPGRFCVLPAAIKHFPLLLEPYLVLLLKYLHRVPYLLIRKYNLIMWPI